MRVFFLRFTSPVTMIRRGSSPSFEKATKSLIQGIELVVDIYIYISQNPCMVYFGLSPFPGIVTTRIISCLVGDSYKPSFATITGKGDNPIYLLIYH